MAEARALPVFARVTVLSIAPRGVEGEPFKAKVQTTDGKVYDLVAEIPPMAKMGDDLAVLGYETGDDAIYVPADCGKLCDRLSKLCSKPVQMKSFGPKVGIDKRPGLIGWSKLKLARLGMVSIRPGIVVLSAEREITNPVAKAAHDTIADLKLAHPVLLVDPAAMLPGVFGTMGLKSALAAALPTRLASIADDVTLKHILAGPQLITSEPQNSAAADAMTIVIPFSPLETSAAEFQRVTGLRPTGYAEKAPVPALIRQSFNLHAMIGMAVADRVGLKDTVSVQGRHARAAFAETFAALTTARQLAGTEGLAEGLKTLADWADVGVLSRGAAAYTGPSIRAALLAVEKGLQPSDLDAGATQAERDVRLAVELAGGQRLSPLELAELDTALAAVKPKADAKTGIVPGLSVMIKNINTMTRDQTGALIGANAHAAVPHAALLRLAGVAGTVAAIAHQPSENADEALRARVAASLKADVIDTVKTAGGGHDLAKAVIERELDRLKDGVLVTIYPAGMGAAYPYIETYKTFAGASWQAMSDIRNEHLWNDGGALNTADPARKPVASIRPRM